MSIGLAAQNIVPYPLVALIVLRDVVLFSGTFYLRLKHKPPDAPIFDTSATATFEIIPSTLSKINTLCQFSCIILGMSNFTLGFPLIEHLEPLFWLTAGTTLVWLLLLLLLVYSAIHFHTLFIIYLFIYLFIYSNNNKKNSVTYLNNLLLHL